ncbi:hypothetical protein [Clostridium butyricum]
MKKQDIKEIIESTILIAKCSIEFNKELILITFKEIYGRANN